MKRVFLSLLLSINLLAFSQEADLINTDRPDQSEGTYILNKKNFQAEGGINFSEGSTVNNFMLRYGVAKNTEIRAETNIYWQSKNPLNNFVFSMKQRIIKKENMPNFALVGYLNYDNLAAQKVTADVLLAVDYDFTQKWCFVYNIGSSNGFENAIITSQIGYSITDYIYTFVEYFGVFNPKITPTHNVDTGILYIINPNFQVDIAAGRSLFSENADYFVTLGIAYRFMKH